MTNGPATLVMAVLHALQPQGHSKKLFPIGFMLRIVFSVNTIFNHVMIKPQETGYSYSVSKRCLVLKRKVYAGSAQIVSTIKSSRISVVVRKISTHWQNSKNLNIPVSSSPLPLFPSSSFLSQPFDYLTLFTRHL